VEIGVLLFFEERVLERYICVPEMVARGLGFFFWRSGSPFDGFLTAAIRDRFEVYEVFMILMAPLRKDERPLPHCATKSTDTQNFPCCSKKKTRFTL